MLSFQLVKSWLAEFKISQWSQVTVHFQNIWKNEPKSTLQKITIEK